MNKRDYLRPTVSVTELDGEVFLTMSIEAVNQDGFDLDTIIGDKYWKGI